DVLFLDEPFTGLDSPTRESLIADLARAIRGRAITTLFVTHDREEAISLADRVGILLRGRLRQIGTPEQVFATPADPELAAFVGVENILPARVLGSDDELTRLQLASSVLEVTATPPPGEDFPLVGIQPDDIVIAHDALARILAGVPALPAASVPLLDALGLVLAEDVSADRDVPPFRNSAMDGYAVRADDVARAPAQLRVVGEIAAGGFPDRAIAR